MGRTYNDRKVTDRDLKEIIVGDIKLRYERESYTYGDYGESTGYWTRFYQYNTESEKYLKFFFFGKECERDYYKFLFRIDLDIESVKYSKEEVKSKVVSAYNEAMGLIERREEIENGNIV
ncbi:MAG: hypothetical protein SLAVMIC_00245 [uncultured marine phage]|uniref:Uncharacterized protein n=1 Tax=uncultured marine phage TaxID=707152 RepID=A0A8D9C8L2_9VIRU|nr:MAG: hypothetical protein SLAVMIC_00245 [uncultured marine phage]